MLHFPLLFANKWDGELHTMHVQTEKHAADILTKALPTKAP